MKDIYVKRATIIEQTLRSKGHQLDYSFPEKLQDTSRIRFRFTNFNPQAEIFATLPVYKSLNRDLFEIIILFVNATGHRFERYCLACADSVDSFRKIWRAKYKLSVTAI